jgi:CRISPR-associated protein Csx10
MRTLLLSATSLSPVAVSSRHKVAGDVPGTLHYLPGSAIRGALATNFMRAGGDEKKDEFLRLFLSDEVRFGNLYPGKNGKPLPLTAWTCKLRPGFTHDNGHGVWDLLLGLAAKRVFGKDINAPVCRENHARSDQRGSGDGQVDLERFTGFYSYDRFNSYDSEIGAWRKSGTDTRILARTSICSPLGTAKYGQLYSLEALEEGQLFWGYIYCRDDVESKLQSLFFPERRSDGQEGRLLFLGTARNRGLGKVELYELSYAEDVNLYGRNPADLKKRLQTFNENLRSHAVESDKKTYFSLTLDSDVILQDDLLRYMSYLDPRAMREDLRSRTGEDHKWLERVELVLQVSSTRRLSGWNEKHGLPKDEALAVSMGSVFLYRYDGDDDETLVSGLQELEKEGLGQRRNEGFGYVCVCDPFHVQFCGGEGVPCANAGRG